MVLMGLYLQAGAQGEGGWARRTKHARRQLAWPYGGTLPADANACGAQPAAAAARGEASPFCRPQRRRHTTQPRLGRPRHHGVLSAAHL